VTALAATATAPSQPRQKTLTPGPAFRLPGWWSAQLHAAVHAGTSQASGAPADPTAFVSWAVEKFPKPNLGATARELRFMHSLAANRTPEHTQTARWFADDQDERVWEQALAQWQQTVGPRQAAWGAKLLESAVQVNRSVSHGAKDGFNRPRPYQVDPTLPVVVYVPPAGSASYPSGHTSRSFTQAIILGHLMPRRRAEFLDLAHQMAMARSYGGVHYPSDTVAGAYEGALVANWMLRHHPPPA
jgi:acid phosphatase (class A)